MKINLLLIALLSLLVVMFSSKVLSFPSSSLASQMYLVHRQDTPTPSPLLAQMSPNRPVVAEKVTYGSQDSESLEGYLAYPEDKSAPLPGVIVIHEWWGLNENIEAMTRQLAGEGYVALAVDLYQQEAATTPEAARELVTQAMNQTAVLEDNLRQAYTYLEQEQQAPKIGSIGWCFGGTWSLNTALLFPKILDASVIYYGGGMETDPAKLKTLEMPILGIFGALDQNPTVETVKAWEATLISQGNPPEVYIYEGADHAFANPSGDRYNEEAAQDAWTKTTAFLAKHLKTIN